jgi:light-regulated signal transduction histidine kinase (bacteriophytochrome)
LETANQELEAFAYSVSHDLRAPLRGIDGWSLALLEDYHDQLDPQARQYLDTVRAEAQRMGQLIDDMLQLSRVTRSDMQSIPIDLSAMAQTVAARLQTEQPVRQVELVIQPGLAARGDPRLLEIVLTNLFSNALKFTGPRLTPRIEFGQTEIEDRQAFFVRDNGVGFDMAFAQKLFGAFQRLHKLSEFPGTGIGLATVQRIIHRHGGRAWAEAQVGQGATFYFTLEEEI